MPTGKVSFSYSRIDEKFALKLAEDLRTAGIHIWIDQLDIRPSEPWDEEIEKALEVSDCLLVILSPTSVESDNVLNEINYALETKKRVLPVLIEKNIKKPFNIRRLQHIDFTESYATGLHQLVKSLGMAKPLQAIVSNKPGNPIILAAIIAAIAVMGFVLIKTGVFSSDKGRRAGKANRQEQVAIPPAAPAGQAAAITGRWITGQLTNPYEKTDKYRIHFDLEVMGTALVGTVNTVSVAKARRYHISKGITEGRIDGSTLSFQTTEQSIVGNENVTFRNFYRGSLSGNEIRFTLQSDRPWGFEGQQFVARRSPRGKAND